MLLLIDNYDSFTYNLAQYFSDLGADVRVVRNNHLNLDDLAALKPDHLVISPGPGEPIRDGGISPDAIRYFSGRIPVLGICLGHQCIAAVFGGVVERAPHLMHGKTSSIHHEGKGILRGLPNPFEATRYHSLIVNNDIPDELEVTASTVAGEIMALQHKTHPTFGLQFHPESILTSQGKQIMQNFLNLSL